MTMKRILFVAMQSSHHTLRWTAQLDRQQWDIHLFAVDRATLRPDWKDVTIHRLLRQAGPTPPPDVTLRGFHWPVSPGRTRMTNYVKQIEKSGILSQARHLAWVIKTARPDVIHVLEMQHAGYLFAEAAAILGRVTAPVVYSSWGSDLYYFGDKPGHGERIRQFLSLCQYHIADCERDLVLARRFGFTGISLGVVPGMGGMDVAAAAALAQPGPVSHRRVIAVKGYHDDSGFGRGLVALEALMRITPLIKPYRIVVYLTGDPALHVVPFMRRVSGLNITFLPPEGVPNQEILKLLGETRVSVALSVSDGTPNALLESMAMGAFPVQSDTVSTGEWIENGKNGMLVPPEDGIDCADAVARAVKDNPLVDNAATYNRMLVTRRADRAVMLPRVLAMYRCVLDGSPPEASWLTWPHDGEPRGSKA